MSRLIWETEQLITELDPAGADLSPAKVQLAAAQESYATREYAQAAAQAERAGALAACLNERFTAYVAAWKALETSMGELEGLGLSTDVQLAALDAADQETVHLVEEEGETVPNYLGAAALLDQASESARRLIDHARVASREIFLASLGIEALSDPRVGPMHEALSMRLERMIEQASHELALGHVSEAREVASIARAHADRALASVAGARAHLADTSEALNRVDAHGEAASAVRDKLEATRDAMLGGLVDGTAIGEAARRMSVEAAAFADHYAHSRKLLENSERLYVGLVLEGLPADDGEAALSEARQHLDVGDWPGVKDRVARASEALVHVREERMLLTLAILEIDERAASWKECPPPTAQGVQDILSRARDAVQTGRLGDARVEILRAKDIVMEATRPETIDAQQATAVSPDAPAQPACPTGGDPR